MKLLVCLLAALSANLALAQKKDYGTDFRGPLLAGNATVTHPLKTGNLASRPATCTAGDLYFATDGPAQRRVSVCDSTNTWVDTAFSHGTSDPGTCAVGQIFVRTDTPAIKVCTATNTWSTIAGGSAGGLCTPTNASGSLQIPSTCIVFLSDGTPNTLGTNGTIGTFSGSGDVWVYLNSSGQFIAAHNLTGATCSILNCLSGQSGFPDRSRPIAKVSVVSGALQPATIVDYERTPQAPGTGGGHVIADEGSNLAAQPKLNFTGSGVTCTNNSGASRTDCDIPGGGGATISNWLVTIGGTEYFFGTAVPFAITAPPGSGWTSVNASGTPTFAQAGSTRTITQAASNDFGCETRSLSLSGTQTLTAVISGTAWRSSGNPGFFLILKEASGKALAYGSFSNGTITTRIGWERFTSAWASDLGIQVDANTDFGPSVVMKLTFSTTNVTAFSMSNNGKVFSPTNRGIGTWAGAGLGGAPDQIGWCVSGGSAGLVSWNLQ